MYEQPYLPDDAWSLGASAQAPFGRLPKTESAVLRRPRHILPADLGELGSSIILDSSRIGVHSQTWGQSRTYLDFTHEDDAPLLAALREWQRRGADVKGVRLQDSLKRRPLGVASAGVAYFVESFAPMSVVFNRDSDSGFRVMLKGRARYNPSNTFDCFGWPTGVVTRWITARALKESGTPLLPLDFKNPAL